MTNVEDVYTSLGWYPFNTPLRITFAKFIHPEEKEKESHESHSRPDKQLSNDSLRVPSRVSREENEENEENEEEKEEEEEEEKVEGRKISKSRDSKREILAIASMVKNIVEIERDFSLREGGGKESREKFWELLR